MRPIQFHADSLVTLLRRERIATIEQLKATLGTSVDMTVFRKLREIPYHTSYSHRGRYYALDDVAHFDKRGLWTYRDVHFSRLGSLVETSERFVSDAVQGLFASELAQIVQVDVAEPLLRLVREERLARQKVAGAYLYWLGNRPGGGVRSWRVRRARRNSTGADPARSTRARRLSSCSSACLTSANAVSSPGLSRWCSDGVEIEAWRS